MYRYDITNCRTSIRFNRSVYFQKLKHWRGEEEVSVRCSLVSDSPERKPHFHRLAKKIGSQIQINQYQEGEVLKMNDCLIAK